jgi:CubicO group peptidase (beta-lactamase class C family)
MNDTAFWVPSDKTERFTSCYQPEGKGRALKLQDDARESTYAKPPKLESGGGGLGSQGEYFWGGAAATTFWIDPKEELTVVFMTQVIGSEARLTLRRDLRTLVYSAMTESFA